jgi:hypothetical protein
MLRWYGETQTLLTRFEKDIQNRTELIQDNRIEYGARINKYLCVHHLP